jgi:hypothetical protein
LVITVNFCSDGVKMNLIRFNYRMVTKSIAISLALAATACQHTESADSRTATASDAPSVAAVVRQQMYAETCGTLVLRDGQSWLQVTSGNSEDNGDRLLMTRVEDVKSRLLALSATLAKVCINAAFSNPDPVDIESVSQIKEISADN